MDEPNVTLGYAPPGQARPPLGCLRRLLVAVGFGWFGLLAFWAFIFFIARDMADEPGSPMTVPRALRICAGMMGAGLPGLAIAIAALRFGR